MVDTLDIQAIRAMAEAATPGPWEAKRHNDYTRKVSIETPDDYIADCDNCVDGGKKDEANAAFIAAARTDVPALCDEVERLRAELAIAREELAEQIWETE